MQPIALTVAGSDPSGGAGLQADLKVFHACDVYGAAVVAAITVQNTRGVYAVVPIDPELVEQQLAAVLDDLAVSAAKTGMLADPLTVAIVARRFAALPAIALVVDPVVCSGGGVTLAVGDVLLAIRTVLLPVATVITPNLDEAMALTGRPVTDVASMRDAARALVDAGARAVLITGGHLPDRPVDVLGLDGTLHELEGTRIPIERSHGTGCTLTAAITAHLAHGHTLADAIVRSKEYVTRALRTAPAVGGGARPLDHSVRTELTRT